MKKIITVILVLMMALGMFACVATTAPATEEPPAEATAAAEQTEATEAPAAEKIYKVAVLVPFIGDQSYFDSVNAGRLAVEDYPNVETTLIEMGEDKSKWESYYLDACEGGYDLIVGGNNDAEEYFYAAAKQYPDQKFFNFDYVNHVELPNVFAVTYNTPELGYVAGTAASLITQSSMPKANAEKIVGIVVGMDFPAMNDFVSGFCQICYENGVQVLIGYPESFTDSAKAKEIALNMYAQGADVVWQVAGGAGLGVFEAAAEADKYAFGVDSDQTIALSGQPNLAATIVTSFYKDCGASVKYAVDMLIAGTYPTGAKTLGIKEGAVGLIQNQQYIDMVPQEIRDQIDAQVAKVAAGEVTVISALADDAAWQDIKAKATAPLN
ncbi:MAG: hypothetical protein C0413_00505 [Clostridiales bacterium]|nr:hypothetical protein [Clostridiales bacterium]